MSVQAMSWVIDHSKHKGNALFVLLMIANHANANGAGSWPSISTLAKEARTSEATVHRALRTLEESGELEIEISRGGRRSNSYSLPKFQGCHFDTPKFPRGVILTGQGCQALTPQGYQALTPEPSFTVIEPSIKQKHVRVAHYAHPSLLEVQSYCQERKNNVDPGKWFDYYSANGWRVGRNPMKDWRAAVRTWEKNGFNGNGKASKRNADHEAIERVLEEVYGPDDDDASGGLFKLPSA